MVWRASWGWVLSSLSALAGAAPVPAEKAYHAQLSMAPFTLATRANVLGKGAVNATRSGRTLRISGAYRQLASDATEAHLDIGTAMGVPGRKLAELQTTGSRDGQLSGDIKLSGAAIAALKAGGLSIVIASVDAPGGNVWGWLIPVGASPEDMLR